MSIRCQECGEYVPAREIDEFTPKDLTQGVDLPTENFPEGAESLHIWRENGNLLIHYARTSEGERSSV